MVYQAAVIAGTMFSLNLWRSIQLHFMTQLDYCAGYMPERIRPYLRFLLQYYTIFYIVLAILLFNSMHITLTLWRDTNGLHQDSFNYFQGAPTVDLGWPWWLRSLCIIAPFANLCTFIVSCWHTGRHALWLRNDWGLPAKEQRENKAVQKTGGAIGKNYHRDCTIQVITLPVVYSTMAYKSVLRMLYLFTGHQPSGDCGQHAIWNANHTIWQACLAIHEDAYESNYEVADLYEAWALFLFSRLCVEVIATSFEEEKREKVRDRKGDLREACDRRFSAKDLVASEGLGSGAPKLWQQFRKKFKDSEREKDDLLKTVEDCTMQGVGSFVFTCALQALHGIACYLYVLITGDNDVTITGVEPYLTGAGLVASCVAIGNVVKIEINMHEKLEHFFPAGKFWSTKILVSIAFIQGAVLNFLNHVVGKASGQNFSAEQNHLVYSCLLCIEIFFIAIWHCVCWKVDEPWLDNNRFHYGAHSTSQIDSLEPLSEAFLSS